MMQGLPVSTDRFEMIELRGGLDLTTPATQIKAGYVRDALNWEQSISGGYSRIVGYERFDGRTSPSTAGYLVLTVNITGTIVVGNTITGVTSGATGKVTSVAGGLVAYTKGTGAFTIGETLNVAAVAQGTVTALGGIGAGADWDSLQRSLAADVYRQDITAVPGSGPIRGVARFNGSVYAWRNNIGGSALVIYKSSPAGWVAVPLGFEVAFTAGTVAYAEGSTLTQGGVTATIRRVALQSGSWGSGTAAGRFIVASVSGGSFAAGAAAGTGAATLSGAQSAITLLPGGRVQTDVGNFGLGPRLYGCDGVNRGFEFDGTYYAPIATGMAQDTPTHVLTHKGHLFFAFGDDLMHSSIASLTNLYPQFNWTAAGGAAQYPMESPVACLLRQPGDQSSGAMSISLQSSTKMLYGNSAADFRVVDFEESAGAKAYSGQRLGGQALVFGDIGVFSIGAAQNFGNFTPSSMTMPIRPWTQIRRNLCTASLVNREKSQYRVFFSDGQGLYLTIVNGKLLGMLPVGFPNKVVCASQGDSPDGTESAFFGSDNGYVYEMERGTSFDGAPVPSYLTFVITSQGAMQTLKNYRSASFEIQGASYSAFNVTYDIGYGSADLTQGTDASPVTVNLSNVYWDAFTWDSFTWDGRTLAPSSVDFYGSAENIAIRIEATSALYNQFTINSILLRFKPRRGMRGGHS